MKVKNKKIIYTIIGVIAVLLVAIAITYAYWLITRSQTKSNIISSACLDISLTNEQNDITLTNQFPLSDADGIKLTPYEFTVTNNCNTSIDYQIALETFEGTDTISPSAIKVMIDSDTAVILSTTEQLETRIANATNAYLLKYGTLTSKDTEGSSASHSLRIWIDENAPISEMEKTFRSKISVTIGQGINATQGSTLASLILNHAQTNNYLYSTTPDFSKVTEDGEYGLYSAQDDYGTSYYFRGDVENNYVELGNWHTTNEFYYANNGNYDTYNTLEDCENVWLEYGISCPKVGGTEGNPMYWRIVRINGDGTIRLIYDGTELVENGTRHTSTIGKSLYNFNRNDAKAVGYTYDDGNGNQIDSIIKGIIDEWYVNNLEQDYGKYMADSIFCNDREITSTEGNKIYYSAHDRLVTNKSPKLTCTNQSDRYTVDDTTKGNGLLTKPIGLITADEVIISGGIDSSNSYVFGELTEVWTMTPKASYDDGWNSVFALGYRELTESTNVGDSYAITGVRPVINLKVDAPFTGSGTITDPYVIGE